MLVSYGYPFPMRSFYLYSLLLKRYSLDECVYRGWLKGLVCPFSAVTSAGGRDAVLVSGCLCIVPLEHLTMVEMVPASVVLNGGPVGVCKA